MAEAAKFAVIGFISIHPNGGGIVDIGDIA